MVRKLIYREEENYLEDIKKSKEKFEYRKFEKNGVTMIN